MRRGGLLNSSNGRQKSDQLIVCYGRIAQVLCEYLVENVRTGRPAGGPCLCVAFCPAGDPCGAQLQLGARAAKRRMRIDTWQWRDAAGARGLGLVLPLG